MGTLRKGTGDPIVKPGSSKPRKPADPKRKSAAPKTSPRPKARPTYARSTEPSDYFTKAEPKGPLKKKKSTPPRDYFTKAEPKGPLKKKKSTPSKADDRPSKSPKKDSPPKKYYKKGSPDSPPSPDAKPSKPDTTLPKSKRKGPMRFSAKAGASVPPNRMAKK